MSHWDCLAAGWKWHAIHAIHALQLLHFQEIEERSKEYRRLWDAIDTHTHDLSTQVCFFELSMNLSWYVISWFPFFKMFFSLLLIWLNHVASVLKRLKSVHLDLHGERSWHTQETSCGSEVVSFVSCIFHCTCIEFCADYWWNQRIRPRDHRKLLRFSQIPNGKEAKSMSTRDSKRWESRVFSKNMKIGGFWMIFSEQPHHLVTHLHKEKNRMIYIRWCLKIFYSSWI